MLLQAKEGLGRAVAAEGAGDRLVGVGHMAVEAGIGQPVGAETAETGDHLHGQPVGAVGAGVGDDTQVHANQLAVCVHAAAIAQRLRMARACAGELLGTAVFKLDRSSGGNG